MIRRTVYCLHDLGILSDSRVPVSANHNGLDSEQPTRLERGPILELKARMRIGEAFSRKRETFSQVSECCLTGL